MKVLNHKRNNRGTVAYDGTRKGQGKQISGRSELEIPATVQDPISDGGTYLLEGTGGGRLLVLVARAVVSPTNNTVIVRLLNPQEKPITLYRNAKIAVIQKVTTAVWQQQMKEVCWRKPHQ